MPFVLFHMVSLMFSLLQVSKLQDALSDLCPQGPNISTYPVTMETLKQVSEQEHALIFLSEIKFAVS